MPFEKANIIENFRGDGFEFDDGFNSTCGLGESQIVPSESNRNSGDTYNSEPNKLIRDIKNIEIEGK